MTGHTRSPSAARRALLVGAAAAAATLGGCRADQPVADRGQTPAPDVVIADEAALEADLEADLEEHRRRIGLLRRTYSRGVIEFRWVDDEGDEHFEPQVNAKLWIDMPRRTALRGEKLGRDLLWLGSDTERFWFFDLTGDDSVLYIGRHEGAGLRESGSPLPIKPLALLDLMGMTEISSGAADGRPDVSVDVERGAWVLTGAGAGGPTRLFLDRATGLPVRVESLSPDGAVMLFSDLRRYASVDVSGVSKAALPRMPTLIDIADPEGDIWVKLALDEPSEPETDGRWQTVFDIDGLTRYLQPSQTHRLGVQAGAPSP